MSSRLNKPVAEVAVFAVGVLVYIWWGQAVAPYSVAILAIAMIMSFWKHSEGLASLGLGKAPFLTAIKTWWPAWLILVPAVGWLGWGRLTATVGRTLLYALWCILQQLAYQKMVTDRLREGLASAPKAHTISGALFALVHLPNPVLTPATFVWGAFSSYLFARFPSVFALGVLQFLLSSLVFLLTPLAWNHGMRIGPGYLHIP